MTSGSAVRRSRGVQAVYNRMCGGKVNCCCDSQDQMLLLFFGSFVRSFVQDCDVLRLRLVMRVELTDKTKRKDRDVR